MFGINFTGYEGAFFVKLVFCLVAGFIIGTERELRGKSAGVSTHSFVIAGSMLFTFLSLVMDPSSPARIAAQIVTGVGFLGAGIILKGDKTSGKVVNLTTAASIWFSASLGMAIGFGWYVIASLALLYSILVPTLPHLAKELHHDK